MDQQIHIFIPGAAKSGTSSLHDYLNYHPSLSMSRKKEPHYFCEGSKGLDESYLALFEDLPVKGESSTGYMVFPEAIANIKESCPDAKFIFLLRNPIDRLVSHYNWLWGVGDELSPFWQAVEKDADQEPVFRSKETGAIGYKNYVQWGFYHKWLQRYLEAFGRERLLILTTERMNEDPQKLMSEVFDFCGLEPFEITDFPRKNKSLNLKYKKLHRALRRRKRLLQPKFLKKKIFRTLEKQLDATGEHRLSAQDRLKVRELYLEDVAALKLLFHYDFPEWKDFL